MLLGELISSYRKEHKLSQRDFAKKCGGLSNGYVSMLENNVNPKTNKGIAPSVDKLRCIANGMDISLNELFAIVDDMPVSLDEENSIDELSSDALEMAKLYDRLPDNAKALVKKMLDADLDYIE